MNQRDPNIIRSGLSGPVSADGISATVEIYRLENQPGWALEVVDEQGTSTVWDDQFPTDDLAMEAFRSVLQDEGMAALLGRSNVVPFRR